MPPKRPYGSDALKVTAAYLKGFYLHQCARQGVNPVLKAALGVLRLPTQPDRDRTLLEHVVTSMSTNPLTPTGRSRRRHPDTTGLSWPALAAETFAHERRAMPHRRYPLPDIERDPGVSRIAPTAFNYTQFDSYAEVARIVVTLNLDGRQVGEDDLAQLAERYRAVLDRIAKTETK
ncbi:hypothetical protein ABZV75_10040 [Streptomyces flaveolus]|uniref:hypothetical protein n=1 Tax=Streptomyces flaveolus TaxID=67297 RepID=UPI00339DD9A6